MVYAAGTVKHNLFTIMPWVRTLVLTYIIVISHIGWFFTSSFLSNSCISLNRCDFSFLDIPFGRNGFYSLVAQVFFYHIFWHMCSWWLCSFYQLSIYNDYHKSLRSLFSCGSIIILWQINNKLLPTQNICYYALGWFISDLIGWQNSSCALTHKSVSTQSVIYSMFFSDNK